MSKHRDTAAIVKHPAVTPTKTRHPIPHQKHGHPECSTCTRPVTDNAYLCPLCTKDLERHLSEIPALVGELAVTYTRSTRSGDGSSGSKSAQTALPWSERASEALDDLMTCLSTWCQLVDKEKHADRRALPHDDPLSKSRWLLWHLEWLRHHESSPRALDELARCTAAINHVMDLKADRVYAGPCKSEYHHGNCDCPCHRRGRCNGAQCWDIHQPTDTEVTADACCLVEIYAKPTADVVVCRSCKTPHNVTDRRAWLLTQAEDQLAHAELIGQALASMGEAVTPDMIKGYATRGRIAPHGHRIIEGKQRALYRVGDVIAVVREIEMERDRKASAKAAKKLAATRPKCA